MRAGRPVAGVMGGSSTLAADPNYRRVVQLTAALTQRGYLVVCGGGLGIMEAANLGAYLAERSDAERDHAVDTLAAAPPWPEDPAGYMAVADDLRARFAPGGDSLAIPTWVIAGEPISLFATHIAKYFSNSIREDGMLAVATAGIVFAPGGAGTMQEIFQDGAQNASRVFGRSPMAFLDSHHYCEETGLYPALHAPGGAAGVRRPAERRRRARATARPVPRRRGAAEHGRYAGDARAAHAQRALTALAPGHEPGVHPGATCPLQRDSDGTPRTTQRRSS